MAYNKSFDLDTSTLSRNIAIFDERVEKFIDDDLDLHTRQGEESMRLKAPWRDKTGSARRTLWATNSKNGNRRRITMGHGQQYGVYLEENNERRFAIVLPTLRATGQSFMRSLERMFAQLEAHVPPAVHITPDVGATRPNTTRYRDERGRFTTRANAQRIAKNAAARARYAVRKAAGTLPTRRTKKG